MSSYSLLQTLDPATGIVHTTSTVGEGRLHSEQCFEHLYLPTRATTFGYGLGYDFSNWFADLPLEGFSGSTEPARWRGGASACSSCPASSSR